MTKLVKRSNFQGKRESCSRSAVTQLTKKQYFVKKKKKMLLNFQPWKSKLLLISPLIVVRDSRFIYPPPTPPTPFSWEKPTYSNLKTNHLKHFWCTTEGKRMWPIICSSEVTRWKKFNSANDLYQAEIINSYNFLLIPPKLKRVLKLFCWTQFKFVSS